VLVALAAVLHDRADGAMPVADEGVIVDQPGRRPQYPVSAGRHTPHHLAVVPGGLGDEVAQVLPRDAQALRHRLHRLAPAVQHQPAQVLPAVATLACVGQVREDIVRELGEVRVQFLNCLSLHPPTVLATDMVKQIFRKQRQRAGGEAYEDDPKGRRRRQVLPLPAICVAPLRYQRMRQAAMRERAGDRWEESGYIFTTRTGRPIEPRNVYRSFTRVAKNADLRVIRLHDARHGCATLLTAAGVAPRVVMEILGHSQIAVTMNVYAHVVQDTQREAVSHMDRLLTRRLQRE